MGIRFVALVSLSLSFPFIALGELRVWKSASGKFNVRAEMVSSDGQTVKLLTEDGRELDVALAKLSQTDQDFVSAATQVEKQVDQASNDSEKQIKRVFAQFYQAVGDDKRGMRQFLTTQGKASYDRSPGFFEDVWGPDRGQRPRISQVRIAENQTAEADYRIRIGGKSRRMQMLFGQQDEQWRILGIIGTGEDGKRNKMDFETAQTINNFTSQNNADDASVGKANGKSAPKAAGQATSSTAASTAVGAAAYKSGFCAKCHGAAGAGTDRGPDLTDGQWDHCDGTVAGIRQVLVSGVPRSELVDSSRQFGMNPATNLVAESDLDALAAYVFALSAE